MQAYCKESKLDYDASDNVLSYLTMAHILGRVVEEFALSCGASIGYWQVRVFSMSQLLFTLELRFSQHELCFYAYYSADVLQLLLNTCSCAQAILYKK